MKNHQEKTNGSHLTWQLKHGGLSSFPPETKLKGQGKRVVLGVFPGDSGKESIRNLFARNDDPIILLLKTARGLCSKSVFVPSAACSALL